MPGTIGVVLSETLVGSPIGGGAADAAAESRTRIETRAVFMRRDFARKRAVANRRTQRGVEVRSDGHELEHLHGASEVLVEGFMGNVLPKRVLGDHDKTPIRVSPLVLEIAGLDAPGALARLSTRAGGLTSDDAAARLIEHGPNVLARDQRPGLLRLLWRSVINPLVILLAVLATVSFSTGHPRAGTVMILMIILSVGLRLVQEAKADSAAAKLKAMISVSATALRDGAPREIPLAELVPGDVVQLAAGDMIPGDVRIVQAKDLFVSQGSLTGESFPVEKHAVVENAAAPVVPLELATIAFLGTSVESGSAS